MGEIDDAGGAKNQDEAQGDEGVDGADADAREKQLQKEIHGRVGALKELARRRGRARCGGRRSVREFDVLVEDDGPLFVAHDVVSVQAVAELVEVVLALRALVALDG